MSGVKQKGFLFFALMSMACFAANAKTCVVEDVARAEGDEQQPSAVKRYTKRFVLKDGAGRPVANFPYRIVLGTGCVVRGVSDAHGHTLKVSSGDAPSSVSLEHDISDHAVPNTQGLYRNQTTTSLETN